MLLSLQLSIFDCYFSQNISERVTQAIAYDQFIPFEVDWRAAIEVIPERKICMKIIRQLNCKSSFGCGAYASGIRQPREKCRAATAVSICQSGKLDIGHPIVP
jgi:hypothetical protein